MSCYSGARQAGATFFRGERGANDCRVVLLDFPVYLFYNEWARASARSTGLKHERKGCSVGRKIKAVWVQ